MAAIRQQESGGNYGAYNRGSGAGGAYQFMPSTWHGALAGAGLGQYIGVYPTANMAPAWLQDAAAEWLIWSYFTQWRNWEFVARAWYGGPGSVYHPEWGGGPGYPNVGQYGQQVMQKFANCGGIVLTAAQPQPRVDPFAKDGWRQMNNGWFISQYLYQTSIPIENDSVLHSGWW